MSSKQKLYLAIGIIIILCFLGLFIYQKATAQDASWVEPNCDPSGVDGPEACAVAAPLNTSDDAQTKTGSLTIDDILTATGAINANDVINVDGGIVFDDVNDGFSISGTPINMKLVDMMNRTTSYQSPVNPITGSWQFTNTLTTGAINANAAITITGAGLTANTVTATGTGSYFSLKDDAGIEIMKAYLDTTSNLSTLTVGGITAGSLPGKVNIANGTATPKITLTGSSGIVKADGAVSSPVIANNNGSVIFRGGNSSTVPGTVTISSTAIGTTGGSIVLNSGATTTTAGSIVLNSGTSATNGSINLNAFGTGNITATPGTSGQFNITGSGIVNIARPDSTTTTPALTINNLDTDASAISANSGSATTISASSSGSGIAISGSSVGNTGVYGTTAALSSTGYGGVKGCYKGGNCGTLGTSRQAGVFEGDTYAWGDVIGSKFLPTNMQYSPYPYLQKIVDTRDELFFYKALSDPTPNTYQVLDMVWDGSYMWMAAETSGAPTNPFVVLKARKEDLEITDIIDNASYSTFNPVDMVDTGEYLGFVDENTIAPFSCNMLLVDKAKMTISDFFRLAHPTGCENIVSDGTNLIIPAPTADAGFGEYGDKIYLFSIDNLELYSYIDFSDNSLVCHNPTYTFYDGYNLWASCSTIAGSEIPNAIIKITGYSCTYGSPPCTVTGYELYNDLLNIDKLFYDGGYLWVTYTAPTPGVLESAPLRKLDPDHTHISDGKTYLNVAKSFAGTDVQYGITDIDFDGANIWLSNFSTRQLHVIPAYGPDDIENAISVDGTLLLEYDGMNMWNSFTSGAYSYDANGINIWSTSNGSFNTESNSKTYKGIRMTGLKMIATPPDPPPPTTEKYCLVVDDSGGSPYLRLFSKSAESTNYNKYCAE